MSNKAQEFLGQKKYAVVGASNDRHKYGNKVLRRLMECGLKAYPVNPKLAEVEGEPCYAELKDLPEKVDGVVVVVPPQITETIVRQLHEQGIERVWMQPGAESEEAEAYCQDAGITCISDRCILVNLRDR